MIVRYPHCVPLVETSKTYCRSAIGKSYNHCVNLQRARYLVALADRMNFTRAAADLHVSQSAFSQQIKVLEREIGVLLIDRSGPRIGLTTAGAVAVREARFLVSSAERAVERVRAAANGGLRLRIAHTRSWAGGAVAAALNRLRERHPEVEIAEYRGFSGRNIELVLGAEVDIAVVRPPIDEPALAVHVVDREEVLIAVPAAHPLAETDRLDRRQLTGQPVVFWPRDNARGMFDTIVAQLWPDDPPRIVRFEADDEHLLRAVAAGIGIAPIPAGRAGVLRVPGVRLCRIDEPTPEVTVAVAYRPDNPNPAVGLLLELLGLS